MTVHHAFRVELSLYGNKIKELVNALINQIKFHLVAKMKIYKNKYFIIHS